MKCWRTLSVAVFCLLLNAVGHTAQKESKGLKLTELDFRRTGSLLLNDPLSRSNPDRARLILLYTLDMTDAAVVLGPEEWRWIGLEEHNPYSLQLLAAYEVGNLQSQLNSGVKRTDRYSGLLTLFRVYRAVYEKDKKIKLDAVENLLALHKEGKLISHLQTLDERKPKKLTPVEDQRIRDLMRTR